MTFDYSKLRGKIVEKHGSVKAFATDLGINYPNLNMILQSGRSFKTETALRIADDLGVREQMGDYFFTLAVRKTEQTAR